MLDPVPHLGSAARGGMHGAWHTLRTARRCEALAGRRRSLCCCSRSFGARCRGGISLPRSVGTAYGRHGAASACLHGTWVTSLLERTNSQMWHKLWECQADLTARLLLTETSMERGGMKSVRACWWGCTASTSAIQRRAAPTTVRMTLGVNVLRYSGIFWSYNRPVCGSPCTLYFD